MPSRYPSAEHSSGQGLQPLLKYLLESISKLYPCTLLTVMKAYQPHQPGLFPPERNTLMAAFLSRVPVCNETLLFLSLSQHQSDLWYFDSKPNLVLAPGTLGHIYQWNSCTFNCVLRRQSSCELEPAQTGTLGSLRKFLGFYDQIF